MAFLDKNGLERLWLHITSKLENTVSAITAESVGAATLIELLMESGHTYKLLQDAGIIKTQECGYEQGYLDDQGVLKQDNNFVTSDFISIENEYYLNKPYGVTMTVCLYDNDNMYLTQTTFSNEIASFESLDTIAALNSAATKARITYCIGNNLSTDEPLSTDNITDYGLKVFKFGSIDIDEALDGNSTNPVQNKVIKTVIGDINNLKTKIEKENLVDAIIAVNDKVGSGTGSAGETLPTGCLYVECWGDSLTLGAGAAQYSIEGKGYEYKDSFPLQLKGLLEDNNVSDFEVKNYGVGGETVETILGRMGAYPMMVMPNGAVSDEEPDNPTSTITITKNLSGNIIASLNKTITLTTVVSGATSYQWQMATDANFANHTNIEGGSGTVNTDGIVELEITVSNDNINKYYRCFFANSDGDTLVTATTNVVQIILKEEEGSIIYWGDDNRFGPLDSYYDELVKNDNGMIIPQPTDMTDNNKCYLFFAEVEEGKTYTFYAKNENESDWTQIEIRRLGFSSDTPRYSQGWMIRFVNGSEENSWEGDLFGADISSFTVPKDKNAKFIVFLYYSSEYKSESQYAICEGTTPPGDLPSNSLPKDYWNGYKLPLASDINVDAAFGFNNTLKGIREDEWEYQTAWESLNLYACKIEGGKIYAISNQNGTGISPIAARRLAFTTEQPEQDLNNSNLYTAEVLPISDPVSGNPTYNLFNASTFLSPEGAEWVVFAINRKFIEEKLEDNGIEYSIQEIASKDTLPTYPTQSSPSATTLSMTARSEPTGLVIKTNEKTILTKGIRSITGAEICPLHWGQGQAPELKEINPCYIGDIKGNLIMNPEKDDKGNVTDYWYSFDPTPYSEDNELLGDGYTYAVNAPTPIITSYMKQKQTRKNRVLILWVGQNNQATWGSNVESFGDRLVESTRAAIAGVDKYLILAAPIADINNDYKITNFKSIYEKMSYAFGAHYVNVADQLVNYGLAIAGKTQEGSTEDKDKVPGALIGKRNDSNGNWTVSDRPHLNAAGYKVVANQVYERGKLLGYWE